MLLLSGFAGDRLAGALAMPPVAAARPQGLKTAQPGAACFASWPATLDWLLFGLPKTSDGQRLSGIEDLALTSNLAEPPVRHPE